MYIATTQEMGNMMPVMDWLLNKEKLADNTLLCGVANGSLGEPVFSWYIGGQPLFAIGLLILSSPATFDVTVQEYLTGDGRRVPLRTSRLAAAAWLNEQLHRGLNDSSSTLIRDLQGLAIAATGCADYPEPQSWQKPVLTGLGTSAEGVVASPAPPPLTWFQCLSCLRLWLDRCLRRVPARCSTQPRVPAMTRRPSISCLRKSRLLCLKSVS